ncbi:MAG: SGNH/GDSL hydrolase family protein [Deltaproteobacteria bacterium]|nr:SGNH/GDSL hydrolase family protein [Deltaproteobacteria bacterium]
MKTGGNKLASLALVLVSLVVGLALFDLLAYPFDLVFSAGNPFRLDDQSPDSGRADPVYYWKNLMVLDPELGYRPRMGPGEYYSDLGIRQEPGLASTPPAPGGVLLLGDSIAAIGFLGQALANRCGPSGGKIYHAGVVGYATAQEAAYYARFCRPLHPKLVILEFCLNDFDGTPVILSGQNGESKVVGMYLGREQFHPTLFRYSTLYRLYLSAKASLSNRAGLADDVARALSQLREMGQEDGFRLVVVVYPLVMPPAQWPESYQKQHRDILAILDRLGLPYYDATGLLEETLRAHPLTWARMNPADFFHPSREFAGQLAARLLAGDLLAPWSAKCRRSPAGPAGPAGPPQPRKGKTP